MPPPQPFMDPHYLYIMTHGYGIVSQLALVASQKKKIIPDSESMNLGKLNGAMCNIPVDTKFHYPQEAPFSGQEIELQVEMPRFNGLAAHVLIKKMIFVILSRSCQIPDDIKNITWHLPNDSSTPRSINPSLFPQSLYENIEKILLFYFQIDEPLLSRGTYDPESFKNMACLRGLTDHNVRRKRYMDLHQARSTFLEVTFHTQFKAAIADLRRSTYVPPPPGQKYGLFKLNPRTKRSRINDDENDES
ncbi:unnamed protein product [Caenorhabditis nigoni]